MDRSINPSPAYRDLGAWLTRVDGLLNRPRFAISLVLIGVAPLLWWNLAVSPTPWFDEGYRLNMAQALVNYGQYSTQSVDGFRPFDPGTSTGPVDIAAIALMISLWGVGYGPARLAVTLFGMIGLVAMILIAQRFVGWRGGVLVVLIALAVPVPDDVRFLLLARQVMGEVPALSLALFGAWVWISSWERPGWGRPILAGVLIGLGLLSKTQMLFGLGPALLVVSGLRGWARDHGRWRELVTGLVTLGILVGWQGLAYALVSPADQLANRETLRVMWATQLVTGSWGALVQPAGWWSVGLTLVAGALTLVRLRGQPMRTWREREWAAVFLSLSAVFLCGWYVLFSVGWVRYSFLASQFSLLVLGLHAVEVYALRWQALSQAQASARRVTVIALALALLVASQLSALDQRDRVSGLIETQAYVTTVLPPTAVIETWEWELAAVIGQERTHIPAAAVLMTTIERLAQDGPYQPAPYDALQADPDYLIVGQMGGWTGLYQNALEVGLFREVAVFGDYRVYERAR